MPKSKGFKSESGKTSFSTINTGGVAFSIMKFEGGSVTEHVSVPLATLLDIP